MGGREGNNLLFHHYISLRHRHSALQLEAFGAIRTLGLAQDCHPWLAGVTVQILQSADEAIRTLGWGTL